MKGQAFPKSLSSSPRKKSRSPRRLRLESLEPRMLLHAGHGGYQGLNFVNGVEFSHGNANHAMLPYHMDPLAPDSGPNRVALAPASSASSPASSPVALDNTFKLHSNPTANHTLYLDFDGHVTTGTTWNSASGIASITTAAYDPSGDGSAFNATELDRIQKIWQRVAEDFSMFNLDVTTEDPGAAALSKSGAGDTKWGIRAVITPTDWDNCGCGGFAYVGSFNDSVDEPVFIFNSGEISTSAAISHEVGHSLYLAHDGLAGSSPTEYYNGHGTGETSWGPIMGSGYYSNVTTFDNGTYYNANNTGAAANYNYGADDFTVITSNNGFGFRPDEAGGTLSSAADLTIVGTNAANANLNDVGGFGIIAGSSDVDYFKFTTGAGAINLTIDPYYTRFLVKNADGTISTSYQPISNGTSDQGSNLDVLATLYDASGNVVATSNPAGLAAAFTNTLAAGTYYIAVDGTGSGNWAANPPTGYDQMASQGQFYIRGTIVKGTPTPNQPPTANNDSASTSVNTAVQVSVLSNDTDPNGDALTITGTSTPAHGTATINGTAITYTPAANYTGSDSFTYTISDGRGGTATGTVNVSVIPRPPILFVDDDQGATYERFYTAALQANGYTYDTWTVSAVGATPTTADLRNYSVVIWNTGYDFSSTNAGLSTGEQTAIAGFLDAGGRLFLSGEDVLYNGVSATFQQNYLKVASFTNDILMAAHTETGVTGNAVSTGQSLSLAAPSDFPSLYVDAVSPVSGAEGAFLHGVSSAAYPNSAINYRGNYAAGGFGIVFTTFPFEAVSTSAASPNNQTVLLKRIVDYLTTSPATNNAPTVATAASASPNPVTGTTTTLSVLGADDGGEANLAYTWAATSLPNGATAPTFSVNGTNAAKSTVATFSQPGVYGFTVTIADTSNLSVTSTATVTVNVSLASIVVSPATPTIPGGGSLQFSAVARDQFGTALASQPTFTWTATAGAISSAGLFTAPDAASTVTITAKSGTVQGQATATITNNAPTVATAASATPSPVTGKTTTLTVLGADDGGEAKLTYTWAATTVPSGAAAPTFSVNGTNAAKTSTATFSKAGAYTFRVTIADAGGQTVTSSVNVTVSPTLTSLAVAPTSAIVRVNATRQYTASGLDQFGVAIASPAVTWSTTIGSISTAGLFTAPATAARGTVTATSGSVSATAIVRAEAVAPRNAWLLNENTGTVATSATTNTTSGTIANGAWVSSLDGTSALRFNGASSKVTFGTGASLSGTTNFTVAAWVRTTATSAGVIVQQRDANGFNGQYQLMMKADGTVGFFVYGNSAMQFDITTTKKINDGQWHHVLALRNGRTGQIFIDGVQSASATGSTIRSLVSTITVAVGADVRDNNKYFNGDLDDVRIYNSALSTTNITALATPPAAASATAVPQAAAGQGEPGSTSRRLRSSNLVDAAFSEW